MRTFFQRGILTILILGMVFPGVIAQAVTDDFIIRAFVGGDTMPPTVPTGLTATPVASSQIDLTWLPSTDNYLLAGYHVWRDDVQIATTTALTYLDTGLTASTTYTYFITAYDSFANESASSTPVSTTTPSIIVIPPPSPDTPSGNQYGYRLTPLDQIILSLEILPQKDSVIIRYVTNMHIQSVIKWGRTSSYELGSLSEQAFIKKHETKIAGLIPGTTYRFVIEGKDAFGREGVLHEGTFTTQEPDDIFPPGNVTGLTATRSEDDVVLSWKLPQDPDLAYVRVVRNDRFYPSDIADGWVVYEGLASGFRDEGAATGERQFYTVFSYDALGNISSGAVVAIRFGTPGVVSPITPGASTTPLGEPGIVDPVQNEIRLAFDDIRFIQEGVTLHAVDGVVALDGAKQLTIAIPYELMPEHLKTILVVLGDGTNPERTFQFLLRVNKEHTLYTSTLAPLGVSGKFPVSVSVFDFTTAQIGYAGGVLDARITTLAHVPEQVSFPQYLLHLFTSYLLWFILLLIILVLLGWRLVRKQES
ncbi:hypothetical protein IPH92_00040 [Candidatus Kaiserbacteria bacterium]|nr:MAG: hypothetical protein IPH92_00040 [Candidatus Kaiserbacteria bacterium]